MEYMAKMVTPVACLCPTITSGIDKAILLSSITYLSFSPSNIQSQDVFN